MKRFSRSQQKKSGFTLIELLVVIAIIGVLSSIVLASVNTARTKAKYSRAKAELQQITQAIIVAQGETGNELRAITGSNCSDCACRNIGSLKNISESTTCFTNWSTALNNIEEATGGIIQSIDRALRDPWGSPYLLDENEGESPTNPCREDVIRTAGEDGTWGGADDYVVTIPFSSSRCAN